MAKYGFNFGQFLENYCEMMNKMEGANREEMYFKDYEFPGGFRYIDGNNMFNDFYIEQVIYNEPATIVMWSDGTKTVCKAHGDDKYSPEVGLILCVLKKLHGSTGVHDLLETWLPVDKEKVVTVADVRKRQRAKK